MIGIVSLHLIVTVITHATMLVLHIEMMITLRAEELEREDDVSIMIRQRQ